MRTAKVIVEPYNETWKNAFDEIRKYGICDIDLINFGLDDADEKVVRKVLEIYQQHGTDKNAYEVIDLIARDNIIIQEEETFIELLKTLQKLAKLEIEISPKELCGNGFAQIISNEIENKIVLEKI